LCKRYLYIILTLFFYSTQTVQQYIVNSIPKCGTHLVERCIQILEHVGAGYWPGSTSLTPEHIEESLTKYRMLLVHLPYDQQYDTVLKQPHIKTFFIYRDPRDQIVSHAHWIYKVPHHHPYSCRFSLDENIMTLITGEHYFFDYNLHNVQGINQYYRLFIRWVYSPYACSIKFEDLVGSQGGGSDERQTQTIIKIIKYLGLQISDALVDHVKNNLFGNTGTFRKGQVGSWQKDFKSEHIQIFKREAQSLLLELGYETDDKW